MQSNIAQAIFNLSSAKGQKYKSEKPPFLTDENEHILDCGTLWQNASL